MHVPRSSVQVGPGMDGGFTLQRSETHRTAPGSGFSQDGAGRDSSVLVDGSKG